MVTSVAVPIVVTVTVPIPSPLTRPVDTVQAPTEMVPVRRDTGKDTGQAASGERRRRLCLVAVVRLILDHPVTLTVYGISNDFRAAACESRVGPVSTIRCIAISVKIAFIKKVLLSR